MARAVVADRRRWDSESHRSMTLVEGVRAAAPPTASVPGHGDAPELRQQIAEMLQP